MRKIDCHLPVYFYSQKGTLQIRMARESHVGNQSIQSWRFPAGQDICPKKSSTGFSAYFLCCTVRDEDCLATRQWQSLAMPEQRLRELIDLQIPQPLYHSYVQLRILLHTMSYMDTRAVHQVIWDPLHHTNNYSGWVTPKKDWSHHVMESAASLSEKDLLHCNQYQICNWITFAKNIGSLSINIDRIE